MRFPHPVEHLLVISLPLVHLQAHRLTKRCRLEIEERMVLELCVALMSVETVNESFRYLDGDATTLVCCVPDSGLHHAVVEGWESHRYRALEGECAQVLVGASCSRQYRTDGGGKGTHK